MKLILSTAPAVHCADGRRMALAARDAALLTWLALEGATARAQLAALLWPDADPDAARNALRQRLFQLRRMAGVDLVIGTGTLVLVDAAQHDLVQACAILGPGFPSIGVEFDQWLAVQRARLQQRQEAALRLRCDDEEQRSDYAAALALAREMLALAPLSEEAHRRVIRLHYLNGDRAAALLAFDHCERILKDEVGARPSAQTLALLATVDASASTVEPAMLPVAMPVSLQRPPRLIGRESAWRALSDAWDQGGVAVVSGEGGLGKSRLLGDFARSRGATAMVRARPGDEHVMYAAFTRLFRSLPLACLQQLPDLLRRALGGLLPELGGLPASDPQERAHFFHAVGQALAHETLALQAVVFDDLQFADDASIELLQHLLVGPGPRWLIAVRAAEATPAGLRLLDGLRDQPQTVLIALAPLTLAQLMQLVDSLGIATLQSERVGAALLRRTGGNPLFVLETLKSWLSAADMPWKGGLPERLPAAPSLNTLIERRIGRLSVQAVQLARCAAVAAPDFSIELASRVLGLRTIELAEPWAELEAAEVFRDSAFAHDLIYESALASVPAPVARQLHAEIAAFLQQHQGEPARLARHWELAGQWLSAGQAYAAAADLACQAARLFEQAALLALAADCYGRGAGHAQRFDTLLQRARTLAAHDYGAGAQAAVAQLLDAVRTPEQGLLALLARFELDRNRSETSAVLLQGRQAVDDARALQRPDLELQFAVLLADALCDARRADEAVGLLEPFADWVQCHAGLLQQWEYWGGMALALDYDNRLRDALPAWERARELAQRAQRRDLLWQTMSNSASTQAKMGWVQQAAQLGLQAGALAAASEETVSLRELSSRVTLAHRLRDLGRYAQALPMLESALEAIESSGASHADHASAEHRLVLLYQQLGQVARCAALLAQPRPGLARGLEMLRLAHRADLAHCLGRDALPMMREALKIIANPDDIYFRIVSLFATRMVPPDEGEAMAADLALWAGARERHGVALSGHVRAAACALAQGAPSRALPQVQAALHLAQNFQPDSFYLPELWLVAARVRLALQQPEEAGRLAALGMSWVRTVHEQHVPAEFRESFLLRNPVNLALAALAPAPNAAITPR
jgi:DNA-binding SARP family transcriptional activator